MRNFFTFLFKFNFLFFCVFFYTNCFVFFLMQICLIYFFCIHFSILSLQPGAMLAETNTRECAFVFVVVGLARGKTFVRA